MSRMNELTLDIQLMLEQERDPRYIAKILDIPLNWVYETMDLQTEVELCVE